MLEKQLQQLGFGKNEIKIYLALFELGKCKAADVIEKTKLHRNIVYQDLEDLVKRELVTKTEGRGVFEYVANNPQSLIDEFASKKELSQKVASELIKKQTEAPREVVVYEGIDGLKKSRNKILNYPPGSEVFIFGADLSPTMERQMRLLHKKRDDQGIGMRILYDRDAKKEDVDWRNTLEHSVAKYLPFSQSFPIWFSGIGEHLEIGIPQQNNPLIFNIRNKEVVEGFRTFFNHFWNQDSVSYQGAKEVELAYNEILDKAKSSQDVVIFAAKPSVKRSADFNLDWNKQMAQKVGRLRLMYYGENQINQERAQSLREIGAEAKVISTGQSLPISTIVTDDTVLTVVWEENPTCFRMKNKTVAESLKNNFELLWGQEVVVESGFEAMKKVFDDMINELEPGEEYCALGASLPTNKKFDKFFEDFHRKRIQKGVRLRMLAYKEYYQRQRDRFSRCGDPDGKFSELKIFPAPLGVPMQTTLYKDKTRIIIFSENPTVLYIDNKEIYNGFRQQFEDQWNQKVTVERGLEPLKRTIYEMLDELEPGDEYCALGASSGDYHSDVQKLYNKFHADRIKKGVKTKMLVYKESYQQIKKRFEECGDKAGEVSFLRQYASSPLIPMQVNLYNNKAFFIFYGQTPTVWKFDSREIHDGLKTYFDDLWGQESYVLRGPEAVRDVWLESIDCGGLRFINAQGFFVEQYPDMFKEVLKKAKQNPKYIAKNIVGTEIKGRPVTKLPWMKIKYNLTGPKNPNVVWLYGDKAAISNWAEGEPAVFISTNKNLVQSYNDYFEELWKMK